MEAEILAEIRDSEKKAEDIIERAKREKESMMHEAVTSSSKMLLVKQEDTKKAQEKKISDFREKARLIREEKISDGKAQAKQLSAKAEKNISKASDFVLKRFEEMVENA